MLQRILSRCQSPFDLTNDSCSVQYIIDATQPASDKIFDVSAFEKFLHDRIKVEGRCGNLGDNVVISSAGETKIEVVAHIPFSGRYLKYLYVSSDSTPGFVTSGLGPLTIFFLPPQDQEVPQEAAAP